MSICDMLKIVGRLKISAAASFFGFLALILVAMFQMGAVQQAKSTAISLKYPFYIEFNEKFCRSLQKGVSKIEIENAYLIADTLAPIRGDDFIDLSVRRVIDGKATVEIGSAQARKEKPINLFDYLNIPIDISANSQENTQDKLPDGFDFGDYEDNTNFYEVYVDDSKIRRYYDDGSVLEYEIDSNGRSILSTFKWIERH